MARRCRSPPNNRSLNPASTVLRISRVAGKTRSSGPQSAPFHEDSSLVLLPTQRANKTNRSASGGHDVRGCIPSNVSSKRVSKRPMGNRPDWITQTALFQGEQPSQKTRIPSPNVNEKRKRRQKPKLSDSGATSGSKVATRVFPTVTPKVEPATLDYRTDVVEPMIWCLPKGTARPKIERRWLIVCAKQSETSWKNDRREDGRWCTDRHT